MSKSIFRRYACLVSGLLLGACIASAAGAAPEQNSTIADAARPRVGLVLAGGGAKGGAHVGVLKVLEELRVPIDCIAGTSMGALVGGGSVYLTGRTMVGPLTVGLGGATSDVYSLWVSVGRPIGRGTILERGLFR